MGADGPHYSWGANKKNCSYGFASLRPDGFVGVRGNSHDNGGGGGGGSGGGDNVPVSVGRTIAVNVTGAQLVVTADTAIAGASLTVSVIFGGRSTACAPLQGANVTDHPLTGCALGPLGAVGKAVALELRLGGDAILYTFGFQRGVV